MEYENFKKTEVKWTVNSLWTVNKKSQGIFLAQDRSTWWLSPPRIPEEMAKRTEVKANGMMVRCGLGQLIKMRCGTGNKSHSLTSSGKSLNNMEIRNYGLQNIMLHRDYRLNNIHALVGLLLAICAYKNKNALDHPKRNGRHSNFH